MLILILWPSRAVSKRYDVLKAIPMPASGGSPIFKNQELAVVGGGDTACEEALYLTKYAKHVWSLCS